MTTNANPDFSQMQFYNEQTLTDIIGLQEIEQDLFNQLNTGINNNTLTKEQQEDLINKINDVSQMRIMLYQNLSNNYTVFGKNLSEASSNLENQSYAVNMVEQQLNRAKQQLNDLQYNSNKKMRMLEINTYYGEKYNNHTNILKIIILFCIPILLVAILHRAEILPDSIYKILIIVLISIAVIYVGILIYRSTRHDKMNYQEYTWNFDKNSAPANNTSPPNGSSANDPWGGSISLGCIGPNCCYQGTTYDASLNQCVPNSVEASLASSEAASTAASVTSISGSGSTNGRNLGNWWKSDMGGFGGL